MIRTNTRHSGQCDMLNRVIAGLVLIYQEVHRVVRHFATRLSNIVY